MRNTFENLKDKLKGLMSSFDRLTYEFEEVRKGSSATSQFLSRLLYMSKADRIYAEDVGKIEGFLKGIGGDWMDQEMKRDKKEEREDFVIFINFCIKYIQSTEVKHS